MTTTRPAGPANGAAEGAAPRRQFVRYLFLKVDPRWRSLPAATQATHRAAFEAAATRFAGRMLIRAYSTVGTRGDVDLLIRTGGEKRLSDFLLWECAYAELYFTDRLWPDFGSDDLAAAVAEFQARERRFGGVGPSAVSAA